MYAQRDVYMTGPLGKDVKKQTRNTLHIIHLL